MSPDAIPTLSNHKSVASPQEQSQPFSGAGTAAKTGAVERLSVPQVNSPLGKENSSQDEESSLSHTQPFTLDTEITESVSTGELPSAVSFRCACM